MSWSHIESEPMPDSPLSDSPYEVLGVPADADAPRSARVPPALCGSRIPTRAATRRGSTRCSSPGSSSAPPTRGPRSIAVRERPTPAPTRAAWAPAPPDAAPRLASARPAYGHPGGLSRERYLDLIREWAGRGVTVADPYDPALVRSAPRDIRHVLADALAEEATARSLVDARHRLHGVA